MTTALFPTSHTLRNIHESKEFAQRAALRAYLTALTGIIAFILLISITAVLFPESMKTAPFRGFEPIIEFGRKFTITSPAQSIAEQTVVTKRSAAWDATKIPEATKEFPKELLPVQPEQPVTPGGKENTIGGTANGTPDPTTNSPRNGGGGTTTSSIAPPATDKPEDDDTIVFLEKDPVIDLVALQRIIVYPAMAKRAGVEGTVYISVYIGADGKAKQTRIDRSPNEMLNSAAVEAIMKATFVPAVQDGRNVGCWVAIPITFKLR